MKKIKLIVLLVLGTVIMSNSTYAQSDPVVDFPPMPCNQFPICFTNYSDCEVEICFTLKVEFLSPFGVGGPKSQSIVCKTIPAWGEVCISSEEFEANRIGVNPFPQVIDFGGAALDPNLLYSITHDITLTTTGGTGVYTNPISLESYPNGGGYQVSTLPESQAAPCNERDLKLHYIPGCPGRYTVTNL
jgi:hypothetical protein